MDPQDCNSPALTFGIELEFMVIHPQSDWLSSFDLPHRLGTNPTSAAIICCALDKAGLNSIFHLDRDDHTDNEVFDKWRLTPESVALTKPEAQALPTSYTVEGVELSSPKFWSGDESCFQEIYRLLLVLREIEARTGCRIVTNTTCGFHVHVGCGEESFQLAELKTLFQVATAFESRIDVLHTVTRITQSSVDAGDEAEWSHCNPPSWFFTGGAGATSATDDMNVRLNIIDKATDINEFLDLFRVQRGPYHEYANGHYSAYNFDNLIWAEEDDLITDTIEFRQHTGTLDFDAICAWVLLVTALVRFSYEHSQTEADRPDVVAWLKRRAPILSFTVFDLLDVLGVDERAKAYYTRRLKPGAAQRRYRTTVAKENQRSDTTAFVPLIARIEQERYLESDPVRIAATMQQKFSEGQYGFGYMDIAGGRSKLRGAP